MSTPRSFTVLLLAAGLSATAQQTDKMPRSTPEAEGVSSAGISRFVESAGKSKNEFHSFMFLRHGKVIAEGWWDPYKPELKHTLYSVSKSFTSTAVGFAVSEGRMSVEDKVVSFFPHELPDTISPYLAGLTVKDMLSMLEGQDPDPTVSVAMSGPDWVKGFLAKPIVHKPGTSFLYNTMGVYILSAIVQKVTGQKVIDYLTPRLFKPLGIRGMDWEVSPQDVNVGGWGLRLKTEDMAKFGQLYLQHGSWNGKQILPASWITEAVTSRNDEGPGWASRTPKDSSDWRQGYGYLFWRCRHDAFRADGADGQYIIVMPDLDAVVAITCETHDMQNEINYVWDYLLPAIHEGALPDDQAGDLALKKQLSLLALPPAPKVPNVPIASTLSDRQIIITPNKAHITDMAFGFEKDKCQVTFKTDTDTTKIAFGRGKWVIGETTRSGPSLSGAKPNIPGNTNFKVAGSYTWLDDNTMELVLRYIESPHTQTIFCHFTGDQVLLDFRNSF